ncbi:MAG: DNA methyltransferase [Candidatus Diapherotrites archaeon]
MQQLIFVLGRDNKISLAEIACYFKVREIEFNIIAFNEDAALIEFPRAIDAQKAINALGGTVKIAEVLCSAESAKELQKGMQEGIDFGFFPKKFFYGVNDFSGGRHSALAEYALVFLKGKFKELKLKAVLKHARHERTEKGSRQINPSDVMKWDLIGKGLDLIFFSHGKELFVGRSIACFDPFKLKERDEERPCNKPLEAISLRLARIMLNLSQANGEGCTVLDAFCGIATIPMEALNNGLNAIGIEINPETAVQARKNLEWYSKKFNAKNEWEIIEGDSTKLSSFIKRNSFDQIVSEPHLGPLLKEFPSEEKARKIISGLEAIYSRFFNEAAKVMKFEKIACIILPVIPSASGKKFRVSEKVFLQNFVIYNPMPEIDPKAVPFPYSDRKNRIERLIYLLKKK